MGVWCSRRRQLWQPQSGCAGSCKAGEEPQPRPERSRLRWLHDLFWFLATALLALALAFVLAFQGQLQQYGAWFGPPAIVWAIALLIFWMDAVTWRSRLPFRLTGDRVIHGRDNTDSDEVPWMEVQVTVELTGSGAQTAVERALQHRVMFT